MIYVGIFTRFVRYSCDYVIFSEVYSMLQPFIQALNWESTDTVPLDLPFRIRSYRWYDLHKVMTLFYDTVHHVCVEDYSPEQLEVWAPDELDRKSWERSLRSNICFVAEYKKQIIGFGDLKSGAGEINRLYTHKDFQGRGVARSILTPPGENSSQIQTRNP